MEKSELVVVATPGPINPLKTTLGLSVIYSIPGAQCRGAQTCSGRLLVSDPQRNYTAQKYCCP